MYQGQRNLAAFRWPIFSSPYSRRPARQRLHAQGNRCKLRSTQIAQSTPQSIRSISLRQ
jgi:hypothetical protein